MIKQYMEFHEGEDTTETAEQALAILSRVLYSLSYTSLLYLCISTKRSTVNLSNERQVDGTCPSTRDRHGTRANTFDDRSITKIYASGDPIACTRSRCYARPEGRLSR